MGGDAQVFAAWQMDLHGHRVDYRVAGEGPPLVLIHGMVNSSRHWEEVALRLADRYTVIAPDLIGHGDSATPRGDYSLGAHAAVIRDLLAAIGVGRATIVGHSLGGGVAMQYFWQFPERTERLVLVSSGGLGEEVSPLLRTVSMPGARYALAVLAHRRVLDALWALGRRLGPRGVYVRAVVRALRPLERRGARDAFLQTLRAVIDRHGQRVSARDRLYLLESMPTLVVWGGRDRTIPLEHGRAAHAAIGHSRFEVIERAAHFPHLEAPGELAEVIADFLDTTEPVALDDDDWTAILARSPRRPQELSSQARSRS
jgi:pimeloyl-ACP methyl ester carboxylesterase